MTSLDDLRATLDLHAGDLTDTDTVSRTTAVHARVRVVRRRRRALAAGGTAAVLAVVAGVALLPEGTRQAAPEPATTVVGLTPPAQLSALDFDYDLTEGIEGDGGRVTVDLPESDLPRLISWGTSGADDRVTITGPAVPEPLIYDVDDFSDFYYVGPGGSEKLTIRSAGGQPGIAVYTLGDARPAGITTGGVTFREAPAGLVLLGAAVSEPGDSEVTVPAEAMSQGIALSYDCEGGSADVYLHLDIAGEPSVGSGSGCGQLPIDAATSGRAGLRTTPGADVTARVYATEGPKGPRVDSSEMRMSLGVYGRTDDKRPAGADGYLTELIEWRGHVWRQVSRVDGVGERELVDTAPDGDRPILAQLYLDADVGKVRTFIDGRPSATQFAPGTGGGPIELVAPGATVSMSISGPVAARDHLTIGFYEQVG